MKKLRNILALVALTTMATFLTGCGGGEGDDPGPAPAVNAPGTLAGKQYTAGSSTITFTSGNTYEVREGGAITESGTYTASRSGDIWTVNTRTTSGQTATVYLQFNSASAGSYTVIESNGHTERGTFQASSGTGGETSGGGTGTSTGTTGTTGTTDGTTGTTGTTDGTTGTTGTTDGTTGTTGTTDGTTGTNGTTDGTTGTTDGTTGTTGGVPAPTSIANRQARFQLATGHFAGSDYVQQFAASTFSVISGSSGAGNYTYTANGNTATLFQTYTEPPEAATDGDNDNLTLTFINDTTANITGTQRTGNVDQPVTGTFTLLP